MIKINNLSKTYRTGFWRTKFIGLKDYSVNIKSGELHGIVGSNGAGKTTLIKMLTGIATPNTGDILINDVSIKQTTSRKKIGYMPESPYIYEFMKGKDYLYFMGELSGIEPSIAKTKVSAILDLVGLSHAANIEIKKYSQGMRQRILLAQSLLHDPQIIVLDEPMSGLDPRGRHELRSLIKNLNDSGKTILFSTHILSDVEALCSHIQIIEKGKLKWFGKTEELFSSQKSVHEIEDIIYGRV